MIPDLAEQARAAFPGLSTSEEKLLSCVQTGEIAYCGPSNSDSHPANQPANAETWNPSRWIRASLIEWLCNKQTNYIHSRGIQIHAARITGALNLAFGDTALHLAFLMSSFPEPVLMRAINARELSFAGSHLRSLDLRRSILRGSLLLNFGCFIEQMADLSEAQIGQDLDCSGSTFAGHSDDGNGFDGDGLNAPSIVVGSDVRLGDGFVALAGVNLPNARIGGDFYADGGSFTSLFAQTGKDDVYTINFNSVQVRRDIQLGTGLRSHGALVFDSVVCGGDIDFTAGCMLHAVAAPLNTERCCFSAANAHIGGDITLDDKFHAIGLFNIPNAHIGGDFAGNGAKLFPSPDDKHGLNAENAVIGGDFGISYASIWGMVSLEGISINGDLNCDHAVIHNGQPGSAVSVGDALQVQRSTIKGAVYMTGGFKCLGAIYLNSAKIGSGLDMSGARLDAGTGPGNNSAVAFLAENVTLGASLLARDGLTVLGLFSILNLVAAGSFDATEANFSNPYQQDVDDSGLAVNAARTNIKGNVRLIGCSIRGNTNFDGASLGGDLDCSSTTFCESATDIDPLNGSAISLQHCQIAGDLFLTKANRAPMRANGRIILDYLQCGGNVFFDGGICNNPVMTGLATSGIAINIFSAKLARGLYFRQGFSAQGEVYIANSVIGEVLACQAGSFNSPHVRRGTWEFKALSIRACTAVNIEIDGGCQINGFFDLSDTTTTAYGDDQKTWPVEGSLLLGGFSYKKFMNPPTDARSRIAWLRRQPPYPFPAQSYIQLAKMLADSGDDTGSQEVLVALEDDRTRQPSYSKLEGFTKRAVLGRTVGYGQEPLDAIWGLVGLTALGWIIYRRSYIAGHMVPTDKDARAAMEASGNPSHDYDSFSPFIYSLENSIPLVKLGQADKWRPVSHLTDKAIPSDQPIGGASGSIQNCWMRCKRIFGFRPLDHLAAPPWVRYFLWFQILLGWALGTLFVAGFTGLIKGK